jgi:hypothetical protein
MNINKTKCKILVCGKEKRNAVVPLKVQKFTFFPSKSFTYVEIAVTWDVKSTADIKQRIAQAKRAFAIKSQLLFSKKIGLQTRKQCVKTFSWSGALDVSESWTIGKVDQKRLEAFETLCWRRMLRMKWTDKIRNEGI